MYLATARLASRSDSQCVKTCVIRDLYCAFPCSSVSLLTTRVKTSIQLIGLSACESATFAGNGSVRATLSLQNLDMIDKSIEAVALSPRIFLGGYCFCDVAVAGLFLFFVHAAQRDEG